MAWLLSLAKSSRAPAISRSEQRIGLGVSRELFFHRIPAQRPAQTIADVSKMANGSRAMAHLCWTDRLLATAQAIEPVLVVVRGRIGTESIGFERLSENVGRLGFEHVATHKDLAFGPLEQAIRSFALEFIVDHDYAVGIGIAKTLVALGSAGGSINTGPLPSMSSAH